MWIQKERSIYSESQKKYTHKYQGYKIKLNIIITTTPEAQTSGERLVDPYDTIEIYPYRLSRENSLQLSVFSSDETVFHEFGHHLNLQDEYNDEAKNKMHADEFEKNRGFKPEPDSLMSCGRIKLYDRYMEGALFNKNNVTGKEYKKHWEPYKSAYINADDSYFKKNPDKFEEVLNIIGGQK